jgi:hypothetical protein
MTRSVGQPWARTKPRMPKCPRARLAQLVEHLICNQAVSGSSPEAGSRKSL